MSVDGVNALRAALGEKVLTDPAVLEVKAHDRSYHSWEAPLAVVQPRNSEDVAEALRICAAHGIPVVPRGSGTGLEGAANTSAESVCIDLSSMDLILEIAADDLYAQVQPGVMKSALNAALAEHGMFFPVGPVIDASFGGMASTSASGAAAVSYGTLKENVIGLTVVLADGSIVKTGGTTRKTSAGYDLTHLFVGAEGTLGVITEVIVKIYPIPEMTAVSVWSMPSLQAASELVVAALRSRLPLTRIELLDDLTVDAIAKYSGYVLPVADTLIVEFTGSPSEVEEHGRRFAALAATFAASGVAFATDPAEVDEIWAARHDALPASVALIPGASPWTTDVCVPLTKLPACILETKQDLERTGLLAPIVGHVGDGNFHLAIVVPPDDPEVYAKATEINERLVDRALAMGGTCTGEHGIGAGKIGSLTKEHSSSMEAMLKIKHALDPQGIINPGKVLPSAARSQHL